MDADVKREVIETLKAARKAAGEAENMFSTLNWFFRAEAPGRVSVLTVADVIAKGIERGLKASGGAR